MNCPSCGKEDWDFLHLDCVGGFMDQLTCKFCNYIEIHDFTKLNEEALESLIHSSLGKAINDEG